MKNKVLEIVLLQLKNKNIQTIAEDVSLISSNYLDSLEFIELIATIENEFKIDVDFSEIDPVEMTTLTGIITYIESKK